MSSSRNRKAASTVGARSSRATFPGANISSRRGKIMGQDFTVESAKMDSVGVLTLRQGKGFHPDGAMLIFLGAKGREGVAGQTFEVAADVPPGPQRPHIHLKRMLPGETLPKGSVA